MATTPRVSWAQTKNLEAINWLEEITRIFTESVLLEEDDVLKPLIPYDTPFYDRLISYNSDPIGQLDSRIPRNETGVPNDKTLFDLGRLFYEVTCTHNVFVSHEIRVYRALLGIPIGNTSLSVSVRYDAAVKILRAIRVREAAILSEL